MGQTEAPGTEEGKAIAKALNDSGRSVRDISKLLSVPKTTVHRWIQEIKDIQPVTDTYADNRITLFRGDQIRARDHITEEKLKGTSAKDLVSIVKQFWEMERVEAGKSTSNIGLAIYNIIQEAKQREREAIDV